MPYAKTTASCQTTVSCRNRRISQIDNPYLDASSNGLSYLIERFKGQPMYGHVSLLKTERSTLASLAAEIL